MPIGRNPTLSALSFQANAGEGRKNKKSSAKSVFLKKKMARKPSVQGVICHDGKWAFDNAGHIPKQYGIPCDFMNRMRSLSSSERLENRHRVSNSIPKNIG